MSLPVLTNMNTSSREMEILCPELTMSHTEDITFFDYNTGLIICIANGLLALPTTILNLLLIISILSTPSLRRPSYILICALGFSDFGVGLLVQPLYIARKIKFMTGDYETYCLLLQVGNVFAHIFCSPSLFVVTAISVDRYLAISLRTTYSQRVNNKVVLQYLAFSLVCAGCITFVRFQATDPKYMSIGAAMLTVILSIILYCYFQSLKGLQKVQMQAKKHRKSSGVTKHHSVLATLMIIVTTLFCCYVPFVTVVVTMAVYGRSRKFMIAWEIGLTLLYLNSFLSPVLHFARLKELRQACAGVVFKRSRITAEASNTIDMKSESVPEKH